MRVPRSLRCQPKSFRTDTDRIEHSACHRSTSASTSTAPLTRLLGRCLGILKENTSILLDLQSCQTACKFQKTFALLPQFCQFVWVGVSQSKKRDKHMGLKMSECGLSSLILFSALTWSARKLRSHPNRRSIATPALSPNAPARCRLVDEYNSVSATALTPSALASRLSSGMLSPTIGPGSGCAPPASSARRFLNASGASIDSSRTPSGLGGAGTAAVLPHLHQVLSLHHVVNFSDTLCHLPS